MATPGPALDAHPERCPIVIANVLEQSRIAVIGPASSVRPLLLQVPLLLWTLMNEHAYKYKIDQARGQGDLKRAFDGVFPWVVELILLRLGVSAEFVDYQMELIRQTNTAVGGRHCSGNPEGSCVGCYGGERRGVSGLGEGGVSDDYALHLAQANEAAYGGDKAGCRLLWTGSMRSRTVWRRRLGHTSG